MVRYVPPATARDPRRPYFLLLAGDEQQVANPCWRRAFEPANLRR